MVDALCKVCIWMVYVKQAPRPEFWI